MTLVEFLLARISEDEEAARAVPAALMRGDSFADRFMSWESDHTREDSAFVDSFDPARVLAECAAKRKIIEIHYDLNDGDCAVCVRGLWGYPSHGGSIPESFPCPTLRALAAVYADYPDFREEWRA